MVVWITGRSGAGKTTLAKRLQLWYGGIVLDGEDVRHYFPTDFSDRGLCKNYHNLTRIARILETQGFIVYIAVVSRSRETRKYFQFYFDNCIEIYVSGGTAWRDIYEEPTEEDYKKGTIWLTGTG